MAATHQSAPNAAEMQDGGEHRWPCPRGSDLRAHSARPYMSGWALKCWRDACTKDELRAEIGLPPLGDRASAQPHSDANIIARYQMPKDKPTKVVYRLDYPIDFPPGPCTYKDCNDPKPVHKHMYQSKGSMAGGQLLIWGTPTKESVFVICEGEKAAAAVAVEGYVGISYIGGADSAHLADYALCYNRKVVVWPDNDEAGQKPVQTIAANARQNGATEVWVVMWPLDAEGESLHPAHADAADCAPEEQARLLHAATQLTMQASTGTPDIPELYADPIVEKQGPDGDAQRLLAWAASRLVLMRTHNAQENSTTMEPYVRLPNGLLDNGVALLHELVASAAYARARAKVLFDMPRDRNAALRSVNHSLTPSGISNMKHILPGVVSVMGKETLETAGLRIGDSADIGTNMRYVAFANGIVDKHTGLKVDRVPEGVYLTGHCRWEYKPDAQHPDVDAVMPDIRDAADRKRMGDMHNWWRLARGVMAQRRPRRELITQISEPGAGKSTWRNGDIAALEPYVTTMRQEGLQHNVRGGSATHTGDLVALGHPSWWCYVSELRKADSALLNQASGGEGVLSIRRVGEKQENIFLTGHLVVQGNSADEGAALLGLGAADARADALAERMYPMVMKRIVNPRPTIVDSWYGDRERCEAWIARVVQDCVMAWEELGDEGTGEIKWPPRSEAMAAELSDLQSREAEDWEREFLLATYERCEGGGYGDAVKMSDVMREYHTWHEQEYGTSRKPVSRKMVLSRLKKRLDAKTSVGSHETEVYPVRRQEAAATEPDDTPQEEAISEDWMTEEWMT